MLYAGHRQVAPYGQPLLPLWTILEAAGIQDEATICLDAGDPLSWPGVGSKWLDRSPGGYDWYLGETADAVADPVFTGGVGDLRSTTFWALDGASWFKYDSANEAFMNAWHANGAAYTFMFLVYLADGAADGGLIGATTIPGAMAANVAVVMLTGKLVAIAEDASASKGGFYANSLVTSVDALPAGWHMLAVSVDEAVGAGGGFLYCDGAYLPTAEAGGADTFNSAYAVPGTGSAATTYRLGRWGTYGDLTAVKPISNGSRIMGFASLNKAASKAELDAVWELSRKRLGI
ncbi:MAG: hypothetical protein IH626_06235 [Rhodospirillales bacterium]|nr:hypothetical protein [Rhodospirillales bacterium]